MHTLSEKISNSLLTVDSCQILSDPKHFFESEGLGMDLLSSYKNLDQQRMLFKNSDGVFYYIDHIDGQYLAVKSKTNVASDISGILADHQPSNAAETELEIHDPRLLDAKRVQRMIFPKEEDLRHAFSDFFVIDMPQDTVGGDFYWFRETKDCLYLGLIDCTGHSLQGAMASILCYNLLNQAFEKNIGDSLRQTVIEFYRLLAMTNEKQSNNIGDEVGAEIGIMQVNKSTRKARWCSSGIGCIITGAKTELLKTRRSVVFNPANVKERSLRLNGKSRILLFSDGIIDQFDGTDRKKLGYKGITSFVEQAQEFSVQYFQNRIQQWMEDNMQYDDISMIGIAV